VDTSYISHSHWTLAPWISLPLLFVNQNLVVTAGSTKAWNTSLGGRRIRIPTLVAGTLVSCVVCVVGVIGRLFPSLGARKTWLAASRPSAAAEPGSRDSLYASSVEQRGVTQAGCEDTGSGTGETGQRGSREVMSRRVPRGCPVAAVAGVSMAGSGALAYAARHPGMFTMRPR
jgi:Putative esterase